MKEDREKVKRSTMAKRKVFLALWLAAVIPLCWGWGWGEEAMENAKERTNLATGNIKIKAEEAKKSASEAMQDAKDKTDSWADWALGKFSE